MFYVRSCEICLDYKASTGKQYRLMESKPVLKSGDRLYVDYLGPLCPSSRSQYKFVFIGVDDFPSMYG